VADWLRACGRVHQFGEKGKLCMLRFLNSTVMVRVGGGWITLASFLESNDPCRGTVNLLHYPRSRPWTMVVLMVLQEMSLDMWHC